MRNDLLGFDFSRMAGILLLKEDVVILVAIERRVKIDQIDRFISNVSPEDVEVIAIIKQIVWHWSSFPAAIKKYEEIIIRLWRGKTREISKRL